MECRGCKGAINAFSIQSEHPSNTNEAAVRAACADLLLEGENRPVDLRLLFQRSVNVLQMWEEIDVRCAQDWEIDHIMPQDTCIP